MDQAPTEDEMRSQMFNTMRAAEAAFKAITEYLASDRQPSERSPSPALDYSSLRCACKGCDGVVVFEDYERRHNSPEDTCTCTSVSFDVLDVPLGIKAVYEAVHKARLTPPIVACPKCRRPSVVNDPTKLCVLCLRQSQNENWKKDSDTKFLFEGDVKIKGDLLVEGTHSAVTALTSDTLDRVIKIQDRHRKALALIAQFFHSTNSFSYNPRRSIEEWVGIQACGECFGTGWLARDESCRDCNMKGFKSL